MEFDFNNEVFPLKDENIFQTNLGEKLKFRFFNDIEPDFFENNKYVSDLVVAFIDDIEVGYLRMRYTDLEKFTKINQNFVSYCCQKEKFKINTITEEEYNKINNNNVNFVLLSKIVNEVCITHTGSFYEASVKRQFIEAFEKKQKRNKIVLSIQDFTNKYPEKSFFILNDLMKKILISRYIEYEDHLNYFGNKPFVDFISVYDNVYERQNKLGGPLSKENYQKRGISTSLYLVADLFMQTKEMNLHSSSLQSKEAQYSWVSLEKRGFAKRTEREGYYSKNIKKQERKVIFYVLDTPNDYSINYNNNSLKYLITLCIMFF
jgi:hypothetical protein